MNHPLPIDDVLPRLRGALAASRTVILSAPPGAGKTTRVPPALLAEPWLAGGTIIMLEPRRLAARRAADFMSGLLGEITGTTVGYRIRGDSRITRSTRIEVVTEGVLTRLFHADPSLGGTGLIIFDEFHERSIHADLGLALALDVQQHLRDDLRLLLMSATLDDVSLQRFLGEVPVVQTAGRTYPVTTRYLTTPFNEEIELQVVTSVLQSLDRDEGDLLVFLPGRREIRRVASLLQERRLPADSLLCTLHGDAPVEEQDHALAPAPPGGRKIILATSVAETSLTIEGVRVVIDSGLARLPDFDARRGMPGLVTAPVSRATADQRRGRAGRQSDGICYRLWTEERHAELPAFPPPEILATDLAPLALDLAAWGDPGATTLRFIDPPPVSHLAAARALLSSLGAVDVGGTLTPHGRAMATLPVHPRLAHMILRGRDLQAGREACELAAMLGERDPLRGADRADIDLAARWQAMDKGTGGAGSAGERIRREARRLAGLAGIAGDQDEVIPPGILLAWAYPDRIAQRREPGGRRYQTAAGTGVVVPEGSPLSREEFLAVVEVDGSGTEARVFLAAPLQRKDLRTHFSDQIETIEEIFWSETDEAVIAREADRIGALLLACRPVPFRDPRITTAMVKGVRCLGLRILPWTTEAEGILGRSEWLRRSGTGPADWPDLSEGQLLATLERWLAPFLAGVTKRSELAALNMTAIVRSLFPPRVRADLDRLAPARWKTPAGSEITLQYSPGEPPMIAVKLQEMFGQTTTPVVAGSIPVRIQLLSPAGRPLAVTQDLRTFWKNVYPEVRKEMRGRYPKHIWPEDPVSASPTRRSVKRPLSR